MQKRNHRFLIRNSYIQSLQFRVLQYIGESRYRIHFVIGIKTIRNGLLLKFLPEILSGKRMAQWVTDQAKLSHFFSFGLKKSSKVSPRRPMRMASKAIISFGAILPRFTFAPTSSMKYNCCDF